MTRSLHEQYEEESVALARQGLRVIALASGYHGQPLTFLGMVGILDPPRNGVKESIETLRNCCVEVKMVTGDGMETAMAIAQRVGLVAGRSMSGQEIEALNEYELADRVRDISVFYRTGPAHKLRIVKALQVSTAISPATLATYTVIGKRVFRKIRSYCLTGALLSE